MKSQRAENCRAGPISERPQGSVLMVAPVCTAVEQEIRLLRSCGNQVIWTPSCLQAWEILCEEPPDLLIVDSQLTDLYSAANDRSPVFAKIQDRLEQQGVPILYSLDASSQDQHRLLNHSGWKDFICKPHSSDLLLDRVRNLLDQKILHGKLVVQEKRLKTLLEAQEIEQETAAQLYRNIVDLGRQDSPNVRFDLSPMSIFNGDVILVAYTPANTLHVLLGDFTGHGITASVASIPTSEIFYGMSKKGFGIREIVEEINKKLKKQLPSHMFLAATAIALDATTKNLHTIACGLPDHLLFDHADASCEIIAADCLPLGVVANTELNLVERHRKIRPSQSLYLFTDGVIETENDQGQSFGLQGVVDCLPGTGDRFDEILRRLEEFRGTKDQQDDITLCKVDCDLERFLSQEASAASRAATVAASNWQLCLTLQADSLKQHNPVPHILQHLIEIQGLAPHREKLFVVLTELFVNALDHGLLRLNSEMKQSPEGFARYFISKEQRLQQLENATIRIELSHRDKGEGGELTVQVTDSGKGFTMPESDDDKADNANFFGRGIPLVKEICQTLEYSENGTKATAVFCW